MEKQRKEKAIYFSSTFIPQELSGFSSYSNSNIARISRCALSMGSYRAGHVLAYITQLEVLNFPKRVVLSFHSQKSKTAQKLSIKNRSSEIVWVYAQRREPGFPPEEDQAVCFSLPLTLERTGLLGSLSCLLPPPHPCPSSPSSKVPSK